MKHKTGILTISILCSALFAAGACAADSAGEPGRSSGKANPLGDQGVRVLETS